MPLDGSGFAVAWAAGQRDDASALRPGWSVLAAQGPDVFPVEARQAERTDEDVPMERRDERDVWEPWQGSTERPCSAIAGPADLVAEVLTFPQLRAVWPE